MNAPLAIQTPLSWGIFKSPPKVKTAIPGQRQQSELPVEDLTRLGALSPHLLPDIGFRPAPTLSSPTRTVWERNGQRIAICALSGAASPVD